MPFWISSPASLIVRSPKLQSDCVPSAGKAGDRLCFGAWSREDPDFVLALLPGWSELAAAPLGVLILSRTQLFPGKLVCCHQDTGGQLGKKRRPFQMLSEREKKSHFRRPPISEGDCHLRQTFEGLKWNVATLHLTWRTEVIGNYFCRCLSKETRAGLSKPSCGEAES